jgi:hypothetical protein
VTVQGEKLGVLPGAKKAPEASLTALSRAELAQVARWRTAFAGQRKDNRFFELAQDTLTDGFDYGYFAIRGADGEVVAVQPYFLLDQDMLEGAGPQIMGVAQTLRRFWPGLLKLRTLMVGCVAGEGHLDRDDPECVETLGLDLTARARGLGARLVVLKEFPKSYRAALEPLRGKGFTRIPSMPMTRLDLQGYADFDDYMVRALNSAQRRKLKKKFREAELGPPIALEVVSDARPFVSEIYPLYLATYERSALHFEKLTPEFFGQIGERMADKTRFFIWRREGRIVAFSLCLLQGDDFFAEYVGFDYSIAFEAHLYHWCVRDMIGWAIARGCASFRSSALNYDPKLHMRHRLDPIDLYVRHTSPIANAILSRVLPLIEPTRGDPILKLFPNYAELWD